MIHYRLLDASGAPVSDTIYRSLKRARAAVSEGLKLWAFASRSAAVALSTARLEMHAYASTPRVLTAQDLAEFIDAHELAKSSYHPKYPPSHASSRRALEKRFSAELFGFIEGVSIVAHQEMSCSCRWVRYSCPIWINDKKSNIKGLAKYS